MKRCIALAGALALAGPAAAQNFPAKTVRWIAPFPPGGGTDLVSRAMAAKLTELWGQQVIVDNRPGSAGTIGLAQAAKAVPDGYTIVLGQAANVGIAPSIYDKLPYDPQKDIIAVTQVISTPLILVSHPSLPAKNAKDLIALARAKPGFITYGSPGNGSLGHLAAELIKVSAKVDMLHVPYKGASPAITDLIGGQIMIYVSTIPPALPLIKGGRLKALGATSAQRIKTLPEVPTVAESGIPGYEATNWYGVFLPAGVSKELIAKVHADSVRVLKLPEMQERFASEGGDIVANTPEQFAAFIAKEIPKWAKVVKASGARVD